MLCFSLCRVLSLQAEIHVGMEETCGSYLLLRKEWMGATALMSHLAGGFGEGNGPQLIFWLMGIPTCMCPMRI